MTTDTGNLDEFTASADLTYFADEGIRSLLLAMLKQSIKDIVQDRKDKHAPAEVGTSARWPKTKAGRDCIEFLMPGVTAAHIIAKIYDSPEAVLSAMEKGDGRESQVETRGMADSALGLDSHARDLAFDRNDNPDYGDAGEGCGQDHQWA